MAYFSVDFPDDFISKLAKLGDKADKISMRMLDDSSQILGDALENEIRAKHKDSGELADSITTSDAKQGKDGVWSVYAYPAGKSKKLMKKGKVYARSKSGSVSSGEALYNSDKLFFIEYGTSKQEARPFIQRVTNDVREEITENMQKIYNEEVDAP